PAEGARLEGLLRDRPLAAEEPAAALTALTNRAVAYMESAERPPARGVSSNMG
ncbi:MAG: hypothetical protein H0U79_06120, partial [Solirubrobacterales bacterium]|nr:hypothetical protein [Solirubrobacterales bacterium]